MLSLFSYMVEYLFIPSAYGIPSHLLHCPFPAHIRCSFLLSFFWEAGGLNLNALIFLVFPNSVFSSLRFTFPSWNLHKPVTPAFLQLSPVITRAWYYLYVFCLISHDEPQVYGETAQNDMYVLIMLIYLFQYLTSFCGCTQDSPKILHHEFYKWIQNWIFLKNQGTNNHGLYKTEELALERYSESLSNKPVTWAASNVGLLFV